MLLSLNLSPSLFSTDAIYPYLLELLKHKGQAITFALMDALCGGSWKVIKASKTKRACRCLRQEKLSVGSEDVMASTTPAFYACQAFRRI